MSDSFNDLPNVVLSFAEEKELSRRIFQGDEAAKNELVMATMRPSVLYMQKVCRGKLTLPELISLCYQELMMSVKAGRFSFKRGRFFAFAKAGLRGRLKTHWKNAKIVRRAKETVSIDALDYRHSKHFAHGFRTPLTNPEVPRGPHAHSEGDEANDIADPEIVTKEVVLPDFSAFIARDHWQEIRKRVGNRLTEQQWMILELVYWGDLSYTQIGRLLGPSRQAIEKMHSLALEKIRVIVRQNERLLLW